MWAFLMNINVQSKRNVIKCEAFCRVAHYKQRCINTVIYCKTGSGVHIWSDRNTHDAESETVKYCKRKNKEIIVLSCRCVKMCFS